jgi:hypothetical protein
MLSDVIKHTKYGVIVSVEDEIDYVGRNLNAIWDAATACDEVSVRLYVTDPDSNTRKIVDWAYLVHGNGDDETINDCLYDKWIDKWCVATDYGSKTYLQEETA